MAVVKNLKCLIHTALHGIDSDGEKLSFVVSIVSTMISKWKSHFQQCQR
jgi:hypothetical protein